MVGLLQQCPIGWITVWKRNVFLIAISVGKLSGQGAAGLEDLEDWLDGLQETGFSLCSHMVWGGGGSLESLLDNTGRVHSMR